MAPRYGSIGNPKYFWVRPGEYRRRRHELIAIATAVAVLLVSFGCVRAQEPATPKPSRVTLPRIEANRNVAPAFRYETVIMKNGDVFTGLYRREQGVSLAFVDRDGKEVSVPKSQIAERRITPYTLMPSNFMDVIPESELHHLVAYLGTLQ